MATNDKDIIPVPDNSGSANTQRSGDSEQGFSVEVKSPISMGGMVTGLATESHSGLNRQSSLMAGAYIETQTRKLESAEKEVKKLLPRNAVLNAENKILRRARKRGALFTTIGTVMMMSGFAAAAMQVSMQGVLSFNLVTVSAAALIFFGFMLHVVNIVSSLTGDD